MAEEELDEGDFGGQAFLEEVHLALAGAIIPDFVHIATRMDTQWMFAIENMASHQITRTQVQ